MLFPRGGDDGVVAPESPTAVAADDVASAENASLDDRVQAAMRRLGLHDDSIPDDAADESQEASGESTMNCEDGVCTLEPTPVAEEKEMEDVKEHEIEVANSNEIEDAVEDEIEVVATETEIEVASENKMEDENEIAEIDDQDIYSVAERISKDMSVPNDLAMAAISASLSGTGDERRIEETAARAIVQAELDAIANVPEDCDEVSLCMKNVLLSDGFKKCS